jgi:hypothetical protein
MLLFLKKNVSILKHLQQSAIIAHIKRLLQYCFKL